MPTDNERRLTIFGLKKPSEGQVIKTEASDDETQADRLVDALHGLSATRSKLNDAEYERPSKLTSNTSAPGLIIPTVETVLNANSAAHIYQIRVQRTIARGLGDAAGELSLKKLA